MRALPHPGTSSRYRRMGPQDVARDLCWTDECLVLLRGRGLAGRMTQPRRGPIVKILAVIVLVAVGLSAGSTWVREHELCGHTWAGPGEDGRDGALRVDRASGQPWLEDARPPAPPVDTVRFTSAPPTARFEVIEPISWTPVQGAEVILAANVSSSRGEFVTTVYEDPDMVRIDLRRMSDGLICDAASSAQNQRLEFRVSLLGAVGYREVLRAGPGR